MPHIIQWHHHLLAINASLYISRKENTPWQGKEGSTLASWFC
jgi:hypothetical protein